MTLNKMRLSLMEMVDDIPDELEDLYVKVLSDICQKGFGKGEWRFIMENNVDVVKVGKDLLAMEDKVKKIIDGATEHRKKRLEMLANNFI